MTMAEKEMRPPVAGIVLGPIVGVVIVGPATIELLVASEQLPLAACVLILPTLSVATTTAVHNSFCVDEFAGRVTPPT